jgi:hypothetical protein
MKHKLLVLVVISIITCHLSLVTNQLVSFMKQAPGVPFLELVDFRCLTTMLCKSLIFLHLHSWNLGCRRHWSVFSGERVLGHSV